MHANHREDIDEVYAGDIGAVVGLKDTFTGDTLCDPDHPIVLESINFPEPVISVAIEPKTKADQDKMGIALGRLAEEDPTFRVRTDEETGQTIISGMGELHLEVIVDRMLREFKVEANVGRPQVAYRETITEPCASRGPLRPPDRRQGPVRRCRGSSSSRWSAARASSSRTRSSAARSRASTSGRSRRASARRWRAASSPATRWSTSRSRWSTARTTRWTRRKWRSRSPARWRFKEACAKASPVMLEPIMRVEVTTPEDFMGDVIGDLNAAAARSRAWRRAAARRSCGRIVPLAEMFGYATELRSMTQGRAIVLDGVRSHYDAGAEQHR